MVFEKKLSDLMRFFFFFCLSLRINFVRNALFLLFFYILYFTRIVHRFHFYILKLTLISFLALELFHCQQKINYNKQIIIFELISAFQFLHVALLDI